MVETEFFLDLLMGLLADPARLYGAGDIPDRRICGQVREIIVALAAGAMLADQPCFFPGHVLRARGADALRRAVGDADAHDGKARAKASLRSPTPTDLSPLYVVEHGVGGARRGVRTVVLRGAPPSPHGEDQFHISRNHLSVQWADCRQVQPPS